MWSSDRKGNHLKNCKLHSSIQSVDNSENYEDTGVKITSQDIIFAGPHKTTLYYSATTTGSTWKLFHFDFKTLKYFGVLDIVI